MKPYDLWVSAFCTLFSYGFAHFFKLLPQKTKLNFLIIPYFFWLIKEIIKSSIGVMKVIWSRDLQITTGLEWVEAGTEESLATTIYGNSITLTPGTVTLDVKGGMLLVHALDKSSLTELKQGEMVRKIKQCMR